MLQLRTDVSHIRILFPPNSPSGTGGKNSEQASAKPRLLPQVLAATNHTLAAGALQVPAARGGGRAGEDTPGGTARGMAWRQAGQPKGSSPFTTNSAAKHAAHASKGGREKAANPEPGWNRNLNWTERACKLGAKAVQPASTAAAQPKFQVEAIVDMCGGDNGQQYLVRWVGVEAPTWEPAQNCGECTLAIAAYEASADEADEAASFSGSGGTVKQVRGPPQHGLSSNAMALITSDYGAMRCLSIKWP